MGKSVVALVDADEESAAGGDDAMAEDKLELEEQRFQNLTNLLNRARGLSSLLVFESNWVLYCGRYQSRDEG